MKKNQALVRPNVQKKWSHEEIVYYERLALARIKEIKLRNKIKIFLKHFVNFLALVIRLFAPVEIVRQVGPHHRPLRRHEWDPPRDRPFLG